MHLISKALAQENRVICIIKIYLNIFWQLCVLLPHKNKKKCTQSIVRRKDSVILEVNLFPAMKGYQYLLTGACVPHTE